MKKYNLMDTEQTIMGALQKPGRFVLTKTKQRDDSKHKSNEQTKRGREKKNYDNTTNVLFWLFLQLYTILTCKCTFSDCLAAIEIIKTMRILSHQKFEESGVDWRSPEV